jgi:hypothetical protein
MITIAIPTYNRYDLLKIMAASLYSSDLSVVQYKIRIYDDCSTEYGLDELRQLFPNAVSIIRNSRNLKADLNMFSFYRDFLSSSSDKYLFNADSDLIFNKKWLVHGLELINKTDGVLSLFNATSHEPEEIVDSTFCIKKNIGAAGTLFTRERIEEIINNFSKLPSSDLTSFDWKWSDFFAKNNIRIFCTNESLVQHIGYHGQNTFIKYRGYRIIKTQKPYFDFGRNFKIDSLETGQIINNIFEQFIDQNRTEDERIINLLSKRPLARIEKIIKKILRRETR